MVDGGNFKKLVVFFAFVLLALRNISLAHFLHLNNR